MCSISGFKKVAQYWTATGFFKGGSLKRAEHFAKSAPAQHATRAR
jgi:hypothetical protein